MNTVRKWWFPAAAALLLALAFGVRIAGVWGKGFWLDEILTMRIHAPRMAEWHFVYVRPLNGWLTYKLCRFTDSELILRLPNIIASWGTVLLVGVWLRRASGRAASLCVMLCLGIATCFTHHTSLCRSYGFLAFFTTLACWACWEWTEKPRRVAWAVVFFASGAGILVSRLEGVAVFLALIGAAPFLAVLRPPWSLRRCLILAGLVCLAAACVFGVSYLAVRSGIACAGKTGILRSGPTTYLSFMREILFGVVGHLNVGNLRFAFHHLFRHNQWWMPLWIITGLGLAWLAATRWRLAAIIVVWIVVAQCATRWLLVDFFRAACDARHIQQCAPAWVILFVAGALSLSQATRRWMTRGRWRVAACALGLAWCALCLTQYVRIIGGETARFVKYDRIADWKQIAAFSRAAKERGRCFMSGRRAFEMRYYKPEISVGNLRRCLESLRTSERVYYMPGSHSGASPVLQLDNHDVITIPYEPFPMFVIYRDSSTLTTYWQRACEELDIAFTTAPGHAQIREALCAAWLFSGQKDAGMLKNRRVVQEYAHAVQNQTPTRLDSPLSVGRWTALTGWGHGEEMDGIGFRWSSGIRSAVLLPPYKGRLRRLCFFGLPYYEPKRGGQRVTAWLGDRCLGARMLSGGWQRFDYDVPMDALPGERRLLLTFDRPVSPKGFGRGEDTRLLSLGLSAITPHGFEPLKSDTLAIGEDDASPWLGSSWSHPEIWPDGRKFRWVDGSTAVVYWVTDAASPASAWQMDILPFAVGERTQAMSVLQDETLITNLVLRPGWATYTVPSPPMGKGGAVLKLIFDYAISPESIGMGGDTRALSAALARIGVTHSFPTAKGE